MNYILLYLLTIFSCSSIGRALKGVVNMEIVHEKCFHRSIAPIIKCQLTFQNSVKKSIGKRPFNVNITQINEEQLKNVCCGLWDMTSCMKSAAVKWSICGSDQLRMFSQDINEIGSHQEFYECRYHYSEGSIKCGFPMWATITLVVIAVILFTITISVVHRFYKRRTRQLT